MHGTHTPPPLPLMAFRRSTLPLVPAAQPITAVKQGEWQHQCSLVTLQVQPAGAEWTSVCMEPTGML